MKTHLWISASLLLTTSPLFAQDGSRLKQLDQNADGKITPNEVSPEVWTKLSPLDKDGDGAVSLPELLAGRPGGGSGAAGDRGAFFKMADQNGDGKITADEAGERWERLSKADRDGDGAVTAEELRAAMATTGGAGRPGTPGEGSDPRKFFERLDKDGNGRLTEDEVPAELWARISKADRDGDGAVTREEMKEAVPAAAGRPGASGRDKSGPQGGGTIPKRPPLES